MTVRKLKLLVTASQTRKPLGEVLADWLTEELERPVSRAKARKLMVAGAVSVNGRRVTMVPPVLSSGMVLEARIDPSRLFGDSTSRDRDFELTADRILFEDDDLIFIDKPPGLPAQPTVDETRDSLFAAVGRFFAKRDGIVEPYVGVHHRLDRDTSGVVLFTRSRRVNAHIAKSFSEHSVIKVYQAITVAGSQRDLKREWTIRNHLGRVSSKGKPSKYGAVREGGDLAETSFRLIAQHKLGLWVEAIPKTGRTHQIRVHLSEFGLPILGDDFYGSKSARDVPRLMLHAAQLTLTHPITGRELSVRSPLPADFRRVLRTIGQDPIPAKT